MTKLHSVGLALAIAMASVLAGCQLYFGGSNGSNGPNGDGRPPGASCTTDKQCAAGCFCADGTCTEAGFCGADKDCGTGFHCDTARSSCIPNPACTSNEQCAQGSLCDKGGCVATCSCASDAEAVKQGAGWCDLTRKTCMPGTNPQGACTGAITCTTDAPKCQEGQVPGRANGCFTGACRTIASCEAAPECKAIQFQTDCAARDSDCSILTTGHNCRRQDGTACQPGDVEPVCHCESYSFAGCEAKSSATPRVIFE